MIHIVDFGTGNLLAIKNMLKRAGVEAVVTQNRDDLLHADKIILPGVGAFGLAMAELESRDLVTVLNHVALVKRVPILGICLGAQLMFESSEEGASPGLGWIRGRVTRFQVERMENESKIPNMGWCEVGSHKPSALLEKMYPGPRFYFAHSYHFTCADERDVLLTAHYGYDFVCAVERENLFGVQFHPEKSHKFGMRLLSNFARQSQPV